MPRSSRLVISPPQRTSPASAPRGKSGRHGTTHGAHGTGNANARPIRSIRIIGGDWKRTPLPVPVLDGLRPTPERVRETLFNWLGQRLDGQRCLDLFAGSGALGFEAASRGAARVVMVERHPRAIAQLRANHARLAGRVARNAAESVTGNAVQNVAGNTTGNIARSLAQRAIEIVEADALRLAASLAPGSFDGVFLDPPFGANLLDAALALAAPLVAAHGWLYVEAGAPLDSAPARAAHPFPAGWTIVRQGKAGAVHYHLLQRENEE